VDEHPSANRLEITMKRTLLCLYATILFGALSNLALACAPPATPGAVICFPTTNATVTFPMNVEGAATGMNGAAITTMILYVNDQERLEKENANTFVLIMDEADIYNQKYHLVLNAWDADGNLYQDSSEVTQIGAYYPCSSPASGINFCSPPNGSYQSNNFLQLAAYASSNVTTINTWLNGKLFTVTNGNQAAANYSSSTANNNWQTLTVKAYQGSKVVYTASSNYKVYYGCGGLSSNCSPGIQIQQPANYADINSLFTVQAQTVQNPAQITTMKVYIDNTVVGTSTGPTIVSNVTAAAGTHLLTIQAWDTTGTLYKTQQTVNVY
jgi:hypothetical protein